MRRSLALAALGAALLTAPTWAQRRGGGMSAGSGGRAVMASHSFTGGMHSGIHGSGMGFRGTGNGGFHGAGRPGFGGFHSGFRPGFGSHGRPFFGAGFHHRHFYPGWGWYGGWGWGAYGYPYAWGWGYPWGYGDLGWYDTGGYLDQYYAPQNYANDYQNSDQQNEMQAQQDQIDRLNDEVANLREQREAQSRASRVPQPTTKSESTQLVFRDKHTEEIQNYAVVGQTLWVLSQQRARKIPVEELDLPATEKANEARGVEFSIPR